MRDGQVAVGDGREGAGEGDRLRELRAGRADEGYRYAVVPSCQGIAGGGGAEGAEEEGADGAEYESGGVHGDGCLCGCLLKEGWLVGVECACVWGMCVWNGMLVDAE